MTGRAATLAMQSGAILLALLLAAGWGLPQAHQNWEHGDAAGIAAAHGDGEAPEIAPEHQDCLVCQALLALGGPALGTPPPAAPAPDADGAAPPARGIVQAISGVVIRWDLARGPPRA